MKKMNLFGALAVAAIALVSCAKVEDEAAISKETLSEGIPFEIVAGAPETKTTNDGLSTTWTASDKMNIFHAVNGSTTYVSDGSFTASAAGASVTFKGTVSGELTSSSYDWYAFYPYGNHINTPANTSAGYTIVGGDQTQAAEATATAHLAGSTFPLYGRVLNVAKEDRPEIEMKQAMSVVKVHVTNNSTSALTVNKVTFSTEDYSINGRFYISFDGTDPVFTEAGQNGKSSILTVTGGKEIAKSGTADFYIGVAPFAAASGKKLTVTVNDYSKDLVLGAAATFAPGKIKTLNFDYDKDYTFDELTRSFTDVSGSTYTSWTKAGQYSGATYSGNSAGGNDAIQLRSSANSGIVTTASSSYVTKVAVTWNTNTAASRTLNVYGKNVPYSGTSELYDDNTAGNLIGTIVMGTNTELNFTEYYEYIGFRSEDGAMYLDEIDVHTSPAKTKVNAPTGVTAAVSGTSINVSWTDVASNVGSYIVTCTGQAPQVISQGTQAASFSGLTNGAYTVTVQAVPSDVTLAAGTYAYSDISTVSDLNVTAAVAEVWQETALGSIGTSDVFVIVGTISGTSYVMTNANGTGSAPTATTATITDGKISETVLDSWKWNISGNSTDGYTFYPNGSTTTWLYCNTTKDSGSNNNMRVGTGARKVFELNASNYLVTKDTNVDRFVCVYADTPDWRGYISGSTTIKFYVLQP